MNLEITKQSEYSSIIILVLIIIFSILLNWGLRKLSAISLKKTDPNIASKYIKGIKFSLNLLSFSIISYGVFQIFEVSINLKNLSDKILLVLITFSIILWSFYAIDIFFDSLKHNTESEIKIHNTKTPVLKKIVKVFLFIIGAITIAQQLNINVTGLLAGLGIGGIVIAMGAKDALSNLFASIVLIMDKNFLIGDWIRLSDTVEGIVEAIGFRSTKIRSFNDSIIYIPNAILSNQNIDNYGKRRFRRYKEFVRIPLTTSLESINSFCNEMTNYIKSSPDLRQEEYYVKLNEIGDSYFKILMSIYLIAPTYGDELRIKHDIIEAIIKTAKENNMEISVPVQNINISQKSVTDMKKF